MSHKKTKSLPQQVIERIDEKFTPGKSCHAAKETGEAKEKIFSYSDTIVSMSSQVITPTSSGKSLK